MRLPRKALVTLMALGLLAGHRAEAARIADELDLLEGLSDVQRDYVGSPSRRRVITGGRRSGKTEAVIGELVAVAARGGKALYLSLTKGLAEDTIWDRTIVRLKRLGLVHSTNLTKLRIKLASGGIIQLDGCKDTKQIDKHRGKAWHLVVVDECGAQPSHLLKYLIESSIGPTLKDHEGQLTLAGTPAPVLSGYWAEQAGPERSTKHPRWEWTIHHNPFFAGREARILEETREENDWTEDNVTYRREYLGEWVQDDGVLVYPFNLQRNGIDELPDTTPSGYPLPSGWRFVIGVDVGTTEKAMALVVWGAHRALPDDYLLHAEAHTGMLDEGLADRIRALLLRYPKAQVVIDSTSIGAPYALALAEKFAIAVEPAEKRHKTSNIRMLRDRILSGRVKVLNLPALDGVRTEWRTLGWNDDHLDHHPAQSDHYSDACLYAVRALRNWRHDADAGKPKPRRDSPEALAEAERREAMADEESLGLGGRKPRRRRLLAHLVRLVVDAANGPPPSTRRCAVAA